MGALTGRSGARMRLLALVLGSMLALIALPAALTWASDVVAPPDDSTEVAEQPSGEAEDGGEDAEQGPAEDVPAEEAPTEEDSAEEERPEDAEDGAPAVSEPTPDPAAAPADEPAVEIPEDTEARDGEILVRFRRGAEVDEREEARDEVGAEVEESLPVPDLQL
ncbi:MAG: hypothetical protein ACR2LY_08600, partial [Thermoleophilaceae bacterium]